MCSVGYIEGRQEGDAAHTHFLIDCSKHDTKIIPLFVHIQENCALFNNLTIIEKMIYLMSTCDENSIKQISHFVYVSMNQNV